MTDPKKMAAMALDILPPPDRLKKRPAPGADDGAAAADPEDDGDSSAKAGEMAMDDFKQAMSEGDSGAMWDALKRAVEACNGG